MKIFGIQKLTLLDYPGKTAATIFMRGCDYRCPYCHNAEFLSLGLDEEKTAPIKETQDISEREVMSFLETRKKLLDGVCISGGEPLLQDGIEEFIQKIKKLGFDVKLDTNGQSARKLKLLAENKYIDYVAMDIKNSLENYGKAAGVEGLDTTQVEESIDFLLGGTIPYEFRTTVVREIHKIDDFHKIGQRLRGAKRYYLQTFKDPGNTLVKNLTAYSREEMEEFCEIVSEYIPEAELRG